jgi:hypothetical protein
VAAPAPAAPEPPTLDRLWTLAALAALLGCAVEAVLLAVAAGFGGVSSPRPFVADLARQLTWSVLVSVGVGVGARLGAVTPRPRPALGGLVGLLVAPAAWLLARALHQAVGSALGLAAAAADPAVALVAALKAAQYALLAMALGWLGRRPDPPLRAYALTGAAAGALCGGLTLALAASAAPAAPALAGRAAEELLFPVGLALIVWTSGILAGPATHSTR